MSSDVAIQGIAQDYVTLFIAIPLLIYALVLFNRNSLKGKILLTGSSFYFLLTYLFYLAMGTYNFLFLAYVVLLGCSLFSIILLISSFSQTEIKRLPHLKGITKFSGWFLLINSSLVALMWLSIIVPPLIDGSIYPSGLLHYTTMIVQGFDLGIFLPLGFVSGFLAIKRNPLGTLYTGIYIIFLLILMLALTAKIIFMANVGQNIIPVIFILPTIFIVSVFLSISFLKKIKNE